MLEKRIIKKLDKHQDNLEKEGKQKKKKLTDWAKK